MKVRRPLKQNNDGSKTLGPVSPIGLAVASIGRRAEAPSNAETKSLPNLNFQLGVC